MAGPSASLDMVPNLDSIQSSGIIKSSKKKKEKYHSLRATDDRMSDGEIEEDIMDISLTDDEAELSLYSPKAVFQVQDTPGSIDDDENYEPPSETITTQHQEPNSNTILPNRNSEPIKADLIAETQDEHPADQETEPMEKLTSGELSPGASIDMASDEQSRRSLSHSPSLSVASDPDEYEPPEPAPLGEEGPRPTRMSSVDLQKYFSPPEGVNTDSVAHVSSDSVPATQQQVSVDAITAEAGSHSEKYRSRSLMLADITQVQQLESNGRVGHFTPYQSPLKQFKSFRYHPQYLKEVSSGFRSLTYSHTINPDSPLCRYDLDGVCNDDSCQSQHLRSVGLSGALIEARLRSFVCCSSIVFSCPSFLIVSRVH